MQKNRIIGLDNDKALNDLNMEYQSLMIDLEKSTALYNSSIAAYEVSRLQSAKKLKHLIISSAPFLAEDSIYPKRFYWLLTFLMALLLIWGLYGVVHSSLMEHKDN